MRYGIRYWGKEITLHELDEKERFIDEENKKIMAENVVKIGGKTLVYFGAAVLGIPMGPPSHLDNSIKKREHFDRDAFLRNNTYRFEGRTIILDSWSFCDSSFDFPYEKAVMHGTSPHCSLPVINDNCVSFVTIDIYPNTDGFDNHDYESFEFYTKEDAVQFLEIVKKIQSDLRAL